MTNAEVTALILMVICNKAGKVSRRLVAGLEACCGGQIRWGQIPAATHVSHALEVERCSHTHIILRLSRDRESGDLHGFRLFSYRRPGVRCDLCVPRAVSPKPLE